MTYEETMDRCSIIRDTLTSGHSIRIEPTLENIEWVTMCAEAAEKQIPKKPIDNEEMWQFECPACGEVVVLYHDGKPHHCECGQAIDWEGIE